MPKDKNSRREPPISYRPPKHLEAEFYRRVERSGLSVSGFLTKSVFDKPPPRQSRRPPVEQKELARLLAKAAGIRAGLQAVPQKNGSDGNHPLLEKSYQELVIIRVALLNLMKRKP